MIIGILLITLGMALWVGFSAWVVHTYGTKGLMIGLSLALVIGLGAYFVGVAI